MEALALVCYSWQNNIHRQYPSVYAKITSKVEAWIRSVAPTIKDRTACDLS